MDYKALSKEERIAFLNDQIRSLESQHFQNTQFAIMAEAAADVPEPAEDDQSEEANLARQQRVGYNTQMLQHRAAALEAERRINVARAALAVLEDGARTKKRTG